MKNSSVWVRALVAVSLGGALGARGANLVFDANTASAGAQDGSGIWTNGAPGSNWWNGAANTNWNSAVPDNAQFGNGGGGGTVTVVSPVSVGGITFAAVGSTNYVIQSNAVTLVGTPVINAAAQGTINSILAGSGFLKTGSATLVLGGANTYTGQTTLSQGIIQANASGALGSGLLSITNAAVRLVVGNNVTLGNPIIIGPNAGAAGNGLIQVNATSTGTVSGPITINNNAAAGGHFASAAAATARLNVNGAITSSPAIVSRQGFVVFSGGGSYPFFTIGQDTVWIGANNGIATGAVMNVAASGAGTFDLRGFNQTLAGLFNSTTATITNSLTSGAMLTLNVPGVQVYSGRIGGPVGLTKNEGGTQVLSGASTFLGDLTVNGGLLKGTLAGAFGASVSGRVLTVNNGGTLDFGAAGVFGAHSTKVMPTLVINSGGIAVNTLGNQPLNDLSLFGGTLTSTNGNGQWGAWNINGNVTATGTSFISSTLTSGAEILLASGTGATNTTFNVVNAGDNLTISVSIFDGRDTANPYPPHRTSLTKAGAGTLTFSGGAGRFSGDLNIMAGSFVLSGGASLPSTRVVRVASGAVFDVTPITSLILEAGQTLMGSGTVVGQLLTDNTLGNSSVFAGGDGTPGTLTITGDYIVATAAITNSFDLTNDVTVGSGVNDMIDVTGLFEPLDSIVRIRALAPLTSGTYRLVNYGSKGSSFGSLQGNTYRDTWTLDESVSNQINLIVAAGTNYSLVWQPQLDGNWDTLVSTNWTNTLNGVLEAFADNDAVLFDDSGAAFNTVNLAGVLKPASVLVHASSNYTFTGGGLADSYSATRLTKDGSGTLTLGAANFHTGGIIVSNGAVVLAATGAHGLGPVDLAAGTLLDEQAGASITQTISGSGELRKSSGTALSLLGVNALSGPIVISNGMTLAIVSNGMLSAVPFVSGIQNDGLLLFNSSTQTLAGQVSGAGALMLTGPAANSGSLTLTSTNTFTGQTMVNAGVLTLASTNGPSISGPIVADNNLSPDIYMTVDNQFAPGVVLTLTNNVGDHLRYELLGTTQTLAGIQTLYAGARGVIQHREAAATNLPISTNSLLILDGSDSYFYSGYFRDQSLGRIGLVKNGTGTQTLWGTFIDHTGPTTIGGGSLVLTNVDDIHTVSLTVSNGAQMVVDTGARLTFQFIKKTTVTGGGSLVQLGTNRTYIGANNQGVTMAMAPGALIDVRDGLMRNEYGVFNNWSNNLASLGISNNASFWLWDANVFVDSLNGAGLIDKGQNNTHTLTVGTAGSDGVFDGVIRNTTGTLHLAKTGAGRQTLNAINTYTGITTITGGTLALGASASITGSPRIIIGTGAVLDVTASGNLSLANFQSLEGGGTVSGSVTAATASRIIPGESSVAQTLTISDGLNLTATTTNFFDLVVNDTTIGGGINDLVNVGGLLEPSNAVVRIPAQLYSNGTYRLFNYIGTKSSTFNPSVAGNLSHKSWTLDEATPGQVNLVISGSPYLLKWSSQTSTNWDINTGVNWQDTAGLTNTVFFDADHVVFDDSGAVTNTIGIVGTLKPGSVTVNSASNYFITGGGKISGGTSLTKDGSGTLTLGGVNNDFTGGVIISNGTVVAGGNGIIPLNNIVTIAAPGTLEYTPGNASITISNVFTGAGRVLLTFSGATANNAYLVGTSSNFSGTLELAASGTVGSKLNGLGLNIGTSASIKLNAGTTFFPNGSITVPQPIQIIGSGNNENRGAIRLGSALLSGGITLLGSATIGTEGGTNSGGIATGAAGVHSLTLGTGSSTGTGLFGGDISNGVGTLALIVSNGTQTVTGTNTFTGGLSLIGGTLIVNDISDTGVSGIGNSGKLTFGSGTLRYDGATQTATAREITNSANGRYSFDITNASASLLLSGKIGSSTSTGGLTKLGAGTLVISNTTVTSLQLNPGLTVRGGTLLLAAGQINSQGPANNNDYIAQSAGDVATMTLVGSSSYIRSNNHLVVADAIGNKGTFNVQDDATFWGNYRLLLANNIGATGIVNQSGGTVTLGNDIYVGDDGWGQYLHTGGSISNFGGTFYVGVNAGSRGGLYQIGGRIGAGGQEFRLGNAFGAYGYMGFEGGSMLRANWTRISESGLGVYYQSGGTNTTTAAGFILATAGGTGIVYLTGGVLNPSNLPIFMGYNNNPGGGRAEMTVAGDATVLIGNNVLQMNRATQTNRAFALLNLNGGVVIANAINKGATGGYSVVSFNGGTFRAASSQTILGAGAAGGLAVDAAHVHGGGITFDSSTNVATITQPLLAPQGDGVSSISITGAIGGYVGAPGVALSGGGGSNATAAALFDYVSGSVTGVVVTSPGIGYSSAPTVTLFGGGKVNDGVSATATIAANISGGLTKLGGGVLLLNSASTYTGATLVSSGTLFGTGSVAGAVSVASGATIGAYYGSPVTGAFSAASASLSGGATLGVFLRGTNPTIRVSGDFNLAPTCNLQLVVSGVLATGTHVLVDYAGTFNGSVGDFDALDIPPGAYLTNNLANKSLDLVITNVSAGIKWNGLVDATWTNAGPLNWKLLSDGSPAAFQLLDAVLFDDDATANYTVDVTEAVSPSVVTINNTNKDYTFGGVGSIDAGVSVTKAGPGMLTLATPSVLGPVGQTLAIEGGATRFASDTPVNAYNVTARSNVTFISDRATAGTGITHVLNSLLTTTNIALTVTNGANVTSGQAGLTINGRSDFVGGGATVDVSAFNTLTLLGNHNSAPNSVGVFNKNGEGTLIVSGNNSFWDHTTVAINSGTTIVRNANAFNETSTTPFTLGTNATFQFGHDGVHNNHFNMTVIGDSKIIVDRATPGTGLAQNNAVLTFNAANTLTIMAGGNVTNGTASMAFSSAVLGGDATISVANPAAPALTTASITGLVSQTGGARSLTKNGSGTLTLRPASPNNYTGGTIVNGGILQLAYSDTTANFGTIIGTITVNTGATVRSTVDKGFGFAALPTGGVQTIILNSGLLEHSGASGHGAGQTVYMTAGEIRSNGGTPSTNSGSFRIGSGADPTIYVLASASTSLITGRIALDNTGRFDVQDGTAEMDLLIRATITDGIGGGNPPNGIIKSGAGTLVLNSSNTYSRTTVISNGTLLVNGSISTDAVTVVTGASLGGTGTIAGTVTSSGTVAPGTSPGTLTLQKDYTQDSSATLAIELGGTTAGSYDVLAISGTASLNGALLATNINGYTPAYGDSITILTAATISGTFATTNLPALPASNVWNVAYLPGAVILSVTSAPTAPTGYNAFSNTYVLVNGPEGDDDADGYANLYEYVTGSNPTNGSSAAALSAARTNGLFALKFLRDTNTIDATLIVEGAYSPSNNTDWIGFATNLNGNWGSATNVIEDLNNPANVTAYDIVPAATNRFLRLRITRP